MVIDRSIATAMSSGSIIPVLQLPFHNISSEFLILISRLIRNTYCDFLFRFTMDTHARSISVKKNIVTTAARY
jgi:hypothetical protein